eukprot:CAMPEP_0205999094 /NCGR_PEP_ID=MMETSP1464-20131121/647_1 /ASSEMBLY_ACC=CAM_ASM_001124 /TAXON_ID=119497 /ORGANISM="Exanthemachrysis gayraliae, Strain RCC1523" /LENGTH=30 /DNA_ID= /DNA_START= /DNA_END= /DNA_ORIENTATION=
MTSHSKIKGQGQGIACQDQVGRKTTTVGTP